MPLESLRAITAGRGCHSARFYYRVAAGVNLPRRHRRKPAAGGRGGTWGRIWFTVRPGDAAATQAVAVLGKPEPPRPAVVYLPGSGGALRTDGVDLRQKVKPEFIRTAQFARALPLR